MSRCSGFDQSELPKSNFEGLLAMSRCPGSDWNSPTNSQTWKTCGPCHVVQALIEICSKSQTLKACWPCHVVKALIEFTEFHLSEKVKLWRPAGHVMLSGSDWIVLPKVRLWRPCWQSQVMKKSLIETRCKCQGAKALGQIVQQGRLFGVSLTPVISVIPLNENSSSSTLCPWAKRQAVCKLTGM